MFTWWTCLSYLPLNWNQSTIDQLHKIFHLRIRLRQNPAKCYNVKILLKSLSNSATFFYVFVSNYFLQLTYCWNFTMDLSTALLRLIIHDYFRRLKLKKDKGFIQGLMLHWDVERKWRTTTIKVFVFIYYFVFQLMNDVEAFKNIFIYILIHPHYCLFMFNQLRTIETTYYLTV